MSEESSGLIRLLALLTFFVVLLGFSLLSYSTDSYTFVKYPSIKGEAVICIEGEVAPTNQTFTVINDGPEPTINPYVDINEIRHIFNYSVDDLGVRERTDALRLGCNRIAYGADSDTRFKLKVDYLSHWRPVVSNLEINNLIAGHATRYFISTQDADTRRIVLSRLNITDISREMDKLPRYDLEFNGSAVKYILEQPGNYKADMQAYDGYVWSDVYEAGYTVHVIQTDERKNAYRIYELEDDPVQENDGIVPVAIKTGDNEAMKIAKRTVDGGYVLGKRALDFALGTYAGLRA